MEITPANISWTLRQLVSDGLVDPPTPYSPPYPFPYSCNTKNMRTIKNSKQLKKAKVLKYGDLVVFPIGEQKDDQGRQIKELTYYVESNYLLPKVWIKLSIFDYLKIDRIAIAHAEYGYQPILFAHAIDPNYNFPHCLERDYKALTRLVERLFILCETKNRTSMRESVSNRFEILDI